MRGDWRDEYGMYAALIGAPQGGLGWTPAVVDAQPMGVLAYWGGYRQGMADARED